MRPFSRAMIGEGVPAINRLASHLPFFLIIGRKTGI
jgi:hypothetical protein